MERWPHVLLITLLILLLTACKPLPTANDTDDLAFNEGDLADPTAIPAQPLLVTTLAPESLDEVRWDIYHSDSQHFWNRLFRRFYGRTASNGQEYGWDCLEPLLWHDTTYLFEETPYRQTIQLLDEFLITEGQNLIADPLQRAMFQRDMWAVFDWLEMQSGYREQARTLQERLAQVIRKLALTEQEILSLPDNYEAVVSAGVFPASYQNPHTGFLPAGLLAAGGEWVSVGREGGPMAMTHTEAFPFFGRSVFLVFMRVPGGREATLNFLEKMNTERFPALPAGTEVALVRRTLLIDESGEIVLSPVVESVQIRHFITSTNQNFYQFKVVRPLLFAGINGGFHPVEEELMLFRSHGDPFQSLFGDSDVRMAQIPGLCTACHVDSRLGISGVRSILSYSRDRFDLPGQQMPILVETTPALEAQAVTAWKLMHPTWHTLEILWRQGN